MAKGFKEIILDAVPFDNIHFFETLSVSHLAVRRYFLKSDINHTLHALYDL